MAGGVQNLRAKFEQGQAQETPSPNARGRSLATGEALDNGIGSRQGSIVRSNFFPAEASKPRQQITSRHRDSTPTNAERHAGNKDGLEIQERAKKELETGKSEEPAVAVPVALPGLTRTLTLPTREPENPTPDQSHSNNTTLHGILAEGTPAEEKADPIEAAPVQAIPDPFLTNSSKEATKVNGMAPNGEAPPSVNENQVVGLSETVKSAKPLASDPALLTPVSGQDLDDTRGAKWNSQTPKSPGKALANEHTPTPSTPIHAPKVATPRAGPKLVAHSTPSFERPPTPEPGQTSPIDSPAASITAGQKKLASPAANTSPGSLSHGIPSRGRLSGASRNGGTLTTGGFIKPRPKSPTRPVKLPAHLVASTASSAAKHGNALPPKEKTLTRRASTISNASSFGRSAQGSISRQPSTRPPTSLQNRRPAAAPSGNPPVPRIPDDSFFTRMMRPTASSASKVKDGGLIKGKESVRPKAKVAAPRPKTNGADTGAEQTSEVTEEEAAN